MNKDDFKVTAYFYNSNNLKFRKYLEIKRKTYLEEKNDLNVIMMNPGSSKPKDINEITNSNFLNKFVLAHPDPTQFQIMRIMNNCNLNYAKIINLSDVRNGSSNEFYKLLDNELKDLNHSIFHEGNVEQLRDYLNLEASFIFGWGVSSKLNNLAKIALHKIENLKAQEAKIFGIKHPINQYGYYHPLPRTGKQQENWVKQITSQIKNYSQHR